MYFIPYRTRLDNPRKSFAETRCRPQSQTCTNPSIQAHQRHSNDIDHIPSNTLHSGAGALLYVFEDNEAVIKMIIKGRSPTMRHVSRTHRVALDWWFDRINLDPEIRIRYIDTKHQIADFLTKRILTRDEWNNLINLFNVSHFSSLRWTKSFSLISCMTRAKRIQEQKEERVVSKSRLSMNCSSYLIATSSSAASSPIASKSPGTVGASGRLGSRMNLAGSSFDAASACEERLKDAYLGGLKDELQKHVTQKKEHFSEESHDDPWDYKPVPQNKESLGNRETAESTSAFQKSQKNKDATMDHFFARSPQTIFWTEGVYDMFRKIHGRPSDGPMENLNVNVDLLGMFMNSTLGSSNFTSEMITTRI